MRALHLLSNYGRWCGEMIMLIVFILTAFTILLMTLFPNKELFPKLRDGSHVINDRTQWKHLRFEPGHTRAHAELCANQPWLVILVTSAPGHASAREAIRATWGRSARRANIPLAFVLGAAPEHLRDALDSEDAQYGDLIEGRFHDSYMNLTLKSLSILEWVSKNCPATTRLLKTDDDIFVNVDRISTFVGAPQRRNATFTIWGQIVSDASPVRDARFKYSVPLEEFPDTLYPPFAMGHGYIMTVDSASILLEAARGASFLRLEDVFVTGVLAEQAGVRREHSAELIVRQAEHVCEVRRAVLLHDMRFHEQFDRYAKLLDPDIACPQ